MADHSDLCPASDTSKPHENFEELYHNQGPDPQKDDTLCAICHIEMETSDETLRHAPCRNFFHAECLESWLAQPRPPTCPWCRSGLNRVPHELDGERYDELDRELNAQMLTHVREVRSMLADFRQATQERAYALINPQSGTGANAQSPGRIQISGIRELSQRIRMARRFLFEVGRTLDTTLEAMDEADGELAIANHALEGVTHDTGNVTLVIESVPEDDPEMFDDLYWFTESVETDGVRSDSDDIPSQNVVSDNTST